MSYKEEAKQISDLISSTLPRKIEGVVAITEMKDSGNRHWRQMEWIGFWFEYFTETKLVAKDGFSRGPSFGNVEFDLKKIHVWDLKAHPHQAGSLIPLNDQEAVRDQVSSGGLGYIIVTGDAVYDDDGTFKSWHDHLKGKKTAYVRANEARGASSRRRKKTFSPQEIVFYWIPEESDLDDGLKTGWLREFQTGMRNSNGVARRAKFMLDTNKIPSKYVVRVTPL